MRTIETDRTLDKILTGAYLGADKSLARPGRKQVRKHVRDVRDFNNIETRAVIKLFFGHLQEIHKAYRGADKSLARPGKKQVRRHVRDVRDFNNIET